MALTKTQQAVLEQTAKYVVDVSNKQVLDEAILTDLFNWVHRKLSTRQYLAIINSSNKDESVVFMQRQLPGNAYKYEYVLLNFGHILIELANEYQQVQQGQQSTPFDGASIVTKIKELLAKDGKWQPVKEAYQQRLQVSEVTYLTFDENLVINAIQRAATIKDLSNIVNQLTRALSNKFRLSMSELMTILPGYQAPIPAQQTSTAPNPPVPANQAAPAAPANPTTPTSGYNGPVPGATPNTGAPPQANTPSAVNFNPSTGPILTPGSTNLTITPAISSAISGINSIVKVKNTSTSLSQAGDKLELEIQADNKISDPKLFVDFYLRALTYFTTENKYMDPEDAKKFDSFLKTLKEPYDNYRLVMDNTQVKPGESNLGKALNPFKNIGVKTKGSISGTGGANTFQAPVRTAPQTPVTAGVDYSKLMLDALTEVKKSENTDFFKSFTVN